ncbi:MAG: hypothetical protein AAF492_17870, partial [Verrucomicrobiota bacterium]
DLYLMGNDSLRQWGMEKRQRVEIGEGTLWLAPPEYVILRKLEYFEDGGSDKHLRDIQSMLELLKERLDFSFVSRDVEKMKLEDVWNRARRTEGR